ncbi:MAG: thioredoxin domain-containing protein, partial [Acidimicrobiales bacterium]
MSSPNRLAQETSPYLRQHADNPVDWYPWGPEAFERAQAEDKPILLSVGYSACHWCHVMAHESFEDEATAAVMNERFVNVKVDREQRPDVDAVYMAATQAMTGSGGWPMTVFATPDGEPFYCGTYFPRERRQGMPSFTDVLLSIHDAWGTKREQIAEQATTLTEHLRRSSLPAAEGGSLPGPEVLDGAVAALLAQHDDRLGGFGRAPKFPQTMSIDVLLRDGRPEAVAAAAVSLDHLAAAGHVEHVGGGFARYSVDAAWLVPHFEKMLYDQALLVRAYLHAWQVTGEVRHRQVLDETVGFVLRDLRHPAGGFFSAEDADSEGVEGRFHTWTVAEVVDVLGDGPEAKVALDWYGVRPEGNFEHTGRSIPNRLHAVGELARPAAIEAARAALFEARERRVRPGLDDKVLTEWNGLFVSALAEAAAATGEVAWHHAAVAGGEFLLRALRRPDGRWLRTWQADPPDPDGPGRADVLAFAADHGALVDAFTRLYELTGEARWIAEAIDAADALLELFWDDDAGGVFTVGHDGEQLVARQKDLLDGASPSASSLAAVGLLRLGALTGVDRYRERAEEIVALLGALGAEHPTSLGHLLSAVDLVVGGIDEVVVTGLRPDLVAAYR